MAEPGLSRSIADCKVENPALTPTDRNRPIAVIGANVLNVLPAIVKKIKI